MSDFGSHINGINLIDQRISALDAERNQLRQRKQKLVNSPQKPQPKSHLTTAQKVSIFKNRFRGRDDVYATRWQNAQGRSGYSVACNNEWVRGVCNKPKIKCHECPSREYKTLDEQAIYDHLSGKDVLGLYPLRILVIVNTCYLLAADFDKDGWQSAVSAMAQACVFFEIPYAIEISRSGNGAHLWVFFSEAVQARDARSLGFGLLDKAMEIHPDLSFASYDRLFPNQDIMPEGGFGNLIALPLQYLARQQGNSQFVDNDLNPYSDQWGFIASIETVSRKQLDSLLAQVVPNSLNVMEQTAVDTRPPWEQGAKTKPELIENCPKEVTVTLANHLQKIKKSDIQQLQSKLKQYVEKENPEQFSAETVIKDVVYFLGISINPKYAYANGFDEFKKEVEKALAT